MSAKEMFEDLGYTIREQTFNRIVYKNGDSYIEIDKDGFRVYMLDWDGDMAEFIDYTLLQVILKQVEELGWFVNG